MNVKKNHLFVFLAFYGLSFWVSGCDRPSCTNTNVVFDRYQPGETAYQEELVKILAKHEATLSYWFEKYLEINEDTYMQVYIQNEHVCAKGLFKVENWQGIEGIKSRKGEGYSGAELIGLRYQVLDNNQLLFTQLDRIID